VRAPCRREIRNLVNREEMSRPIVAPLLLLHAACVSSLHASALLPSRPPPRATIVQMQLSPAAPPDAAVVASIDEAAIKLDNQDESFRPTRGADGRLAPVLTLPGDTLETNNLMIGITAASTLLAIGVVVRAFLLSALPVAPLCAVAFGGIAGELFSGTFHWATDNYGRLETPVVGFACAAFQGHHLAPWTISHRSFPNNVYKIAAATLPLFLLGLALLPPAGAAFVATLFYSQVLAQEFHRWSHTPPGLLAPWQRALQSAGVALPVKEHFAHHRPPFDKHYCILTGGLNKLLDSEPLWFWRRLEALVYRWNGQEPNCWKHDPRVKELALRL